MYHTFFKEYTEKVWGVPCDDIPAECGKQRIKDLDISKVMANAIRSFFAKDKSLTQKGISTSLIEQFMYPVYGPGKMWKIVADAIVQNGGKIMLNTEVVKIRFDFLGKMMTVTVKNILDGSAKLIAGEVFFNHAGKIFVVTIGRIKYPGTHCHHR